MIGAGGFMAASNAEAQIQFESPLHEQLHWAEHHANDLTIAEHNRKAFAIEAKRLRAACRAARTSEDTGAGGQP